MFQESNKTLYLMKRASIPRKTRQCECYFRERKVKKLKTPHDFLDISTLLKDIDIAL